MPLAFPQMPDKLTATEQGIVEYIAAHRDEFLCMTIGQLSEALHISEATVSRFARHVGCEDFKHLKRTVVEQTVQFGPAQKLSQTLQTGEGDLLTAWMEQQRYNLQKTLELLDHGAFAAAVEMLQSAQCLPRAGCSAGVPAAPHRPGGGTAARRRQRAGRAPGLGGAGGRGGPVQLCQAVGGGRRHPGPPAAGRLSNHSFYQPQLPRRRPPCLFVYRGDENEQHSMSAPIAVAEALALALSARMGDAALTRLDEIQQLKAAYKDRL